MKILNISFPRIGVEPMTITFKDASMLPYWTAVHKYISFNNNHEIIVCNHIMTFIIPSVITFRPIQGNVHTYERFPINYLLKINFRFVSAKFNI